MLWTEICEIRQIFKGDLIKFSESFTKITWSSPKIVKSLFFKTQSVIYIYFLIKCVVRWSENSVRFEKSYWNWPPNGPNSVRFYLTV